jgi:hypothetical protein
MNLIRLSNLKPLNKEKIIIKSISAHTTRFKLNRASLDPKAFQTPNGRRTAPDAIMNPRRSGRNRVTEAASLTLLTFCNSTLNNSKI